MTTWWIILGLGGLTYLIRLSFIALWKYLHMPDWVQRALYFVPVAVLSAIIGPELVMVDQRINLTLANPRLLVGVVAIGVAYRTRNVFITILVGLVTFWLLRFTLAGM